MCCTVLALEAAHFPIRNIAHCTEQGQAEESSFANFSTPRTVTDLCNKPMIGWDY